MGQGERTTMLPRSFRQPCLLIATNTLAMALSLATVTATVCNVFSANASVAAAPNTFVFAVIWSLALRSEASCGGISFGWVMSPILAAMNAGYIAATLVFVDSSKTGADAPLLFVEGITFGTGLWFPGLLFSIALYAAPILYARRRARLGLSEGQLAERVGGLLSGSLCIVCVVGAIGMRGPSWEGRVALFLLCPLAVAGFFASVMSVTFGWYEENCRCAFVQSVEAGHVEHLRVASDPRGKVLLKTAEQEADYRVEPYEPELALLDDMGRVQWVFGAVEPEDGCYCEIEIAQRRFDRARQLKVGSPSLDCAVHEPRNAGYLQSRRHRRAKGGLSKPGMSSGFEKHSAAIARSF